MAEINEAEVWDALHECYDPEIPVNIVDLGLVYNVDINNETGNVQITMTLTAMGCPMAGDVISEVEMRVGEVENVKSVKCEITFDPPWTTERMTEDAQGELGMVYSSQAPPPRRATIKSCPTSHQPPSLLRMIGRVLF